MVPAGSDRISRVRPYSGTDLGSEQHFAYGALTLCDPASQPVRLYCPFVTSRAVCSRLAVSPTTPNMLRLHAIAHTRFGLIPFRSPLLRESMFLSFPPATEMCHFAGLPSTALCVQAGIRAHYHAWVSPFGHPRVKGRSAPHRGFSQPSTSFIGF